MKKPLLLLGALCAAAASSFAAPPSVLYATGQSWDWKGDSGQEMTKISEGVFNATLEINKDGGLTFGSQLPVWDNDHAYRFGPVNDLTVPMKNCPYALVSGQDRSFTVNAGTYNVTVNTNTMQFFISEEPLKEIYICGDATEYGVWDTSKGVKLTSTDGIFKTDLSVKDDNKGFAFSDILVPPADDWSNWTTFNQHRFGPNDSNNPQSKYSTFPPVDTSVPVYYGGDLTYMLNPGEYSVTLNTNDWTLKVEGKKEVVKKLYLVGNVEGAGWVTNNGIECTSEDGVFKGELTTTKDGAEFTFVDMLMEKSDDWDGFHAHRYGPADKNVINLDTEVKVYYDGDRCFVLNEGTYTYVLDTNNMTFVAKAKENVIYLVGDPAGEWKTNKGISYLSKSNVYTGEFKVSKVSEFAFVSELLDQEDNWVEFNKHRYGPESNDSKVYPVLNEETEIGMHDGTSFWCLPGDYYFTLNLEDPDNMTFTLSGAHKELHVRGDYITDMEAWGTNEKTVMSHDGKGVYTISMGAVSKDHQFKIGETDGWDTNYSTGNTEMEVGQTYPLIHNEYNNMGVKEDANNLELIANLKDKTLTVNDVTTGVVAVEAAGEVEYFDLQGRRVANPEKGLYIVRQGAKVSKQLLK